VETEPTVYADSSALAKLVVHESESDDFFEYLDDGPVIATSRIATVEVARAAAVADPGADAQRRVDRILGYCLLVDVTAEVIAAARRLASPTLRTLDAIHLATALQIAPDEFVAYDRQLLTAAQAQGLRVAAPGVTDPAAPPG
jgi:predicted nucleic acid-binding protein